MADNLASVGGSETIDEDPNKPLWRYVLKQEKKDGGGNVAFRCTYCQGTYKGSYSRVKAHLLRISGQGIKGCPKVTSQQVQEMQKLIEEADLRVKNAMPKKVPLPSSSSQSSNTLGNMGTLGVTSLRQEGFEPRKRKGVGSTALEKAWNNEARDQLRAEIARMFYSGGLPFHFARNPYYVSSYTFAASNAISGFIPPGYNMLRTTLLQRERANIDNLLEPVKGTWKEKGVTLVCDGWTDAQRRPLINFMAVTESGPMFLKAVNCEGEYKDKFFIANLIKETVMEVGPQNVVQVIMDNAPVCKAAGMLVEAQWPHIFCTPCVVHTLNLAFKNICAAKNTEANEITYEECCWITDISTDAAFIKNFIMNHSMRLAMFNEFVNLKMLAIADTRFASVLIMLRRFKLIKRGLQNMVISEKRGLYREDDVGKAQFVKEKVLDDLWWDKIDYIVSFTEPIYEMLRVADTDKPSLHLVYDMWDTMIEKVKAAIYHYEKKNENEESIFYKVVHDILVDRWNKSNTPLHCLAHSLNPRYYSKAWLDGAPNRVAPHMDQEIAMERTKCIRRYFSNSEECRMVNIEFAKFSASLEEFGEYDSLHDRGEMDPKIWWVVHGSFTPSLKNLAFKLLGQPSSSSCCERNWSTYSFINSIRRNKIAPQRTEDLVFVHNNLRLLSRRTPQYSEGDSKMWDIGGDAFDSFEDVGVLGVKELSLDEPDLETVFFMDEGDANIDGMPSS